MNQVTTPPVFKPTVITSFTHYIGLALRTKSPGRMAPVVENGVIVMKDAKKPLTYCSYASPLADLDHGLTGVAAEVGEALGDLKSNRFYGNLFPNVNFVGELGDLWWFYAIAVDAFRRISSDFLSIAYGEAAIEGMLSPDIAETYLSGGFDDAQQVMTLNPDNQKLLSWLLRSVGQTVYSYDHGDLIDAFEADGIDHQYRLERLGTLHTMLVDLGAQLVDLTYSYMNAMHGLDIEASLFRVWGANIDKLRERFPDAFDSDNAIARETQAAEAAALQAAI